MSKHYVYVGTWGNRENGGYGKGIYSLEMDAETGALTLLETLDVEEPSVLTVAPNGKYVYAINELTKGLDGGYGFGGGMTALAVKEDKTLSVINKVSALGNIPCYLEIDPTGSYVLAAIHSGFGMTLDVVRNPMGGLAPIAKYDQAGVAMFKVQEDGGLEGVDFWKVNDSGSAEYYKDDLKKIERGYPGKLPVPKSFLQSHPFIHCITFITDDIFFVTDRGTDQIFMCEIDRKYNVIHHLHTCRVELGQAPRHMTLHPTKPYMYMTNEVESSMSVFEYDLEKKSFWRIQTTDICKNENPEGIIMPCDIHIHPSGQFLYETNRGLDDLVIYDIDETNGTVSMKSVYKLHKVEPRGFAITEDGKFLVMSYQKSDEVETFRIGDDGLVTPTGFALKLDTPTCVRILE